MIPKTFLVPVSRVNSQERWIVEVDNPNTRQGPGTIFTKVVRERPLIRGEFLQARFLATPPLHFTGGAQTNIRGDWALIGENEWIWTGNLSKRDD